MSRVKFASDLMKTRASFSTVLDVGCREAQLANYLSAGISYSGADLVEGHSGKVKYVGDVSKMSISERFDIVVALDILEHLESPSATFDRMVGWSKRHLLVSFPNTYDLKSRWRFILGGPLGGKYTFQEQEHLDRHRWLMNRAEIIDFYGAKAKKHKLSLEVIDLKYGSGERVRPTTIIGRGISSVLPPTLAAETIYGFFTLQTS
jgi:2-polyprenyl-3-methyl-5-hydroxy-6-metoxy-1,4-benzoquinol methylase